MNNRVSVYVRVKPLHDQGSIVHILDDKTIIFDPVDTESQPNDVYMYHGQQFRSIGTKKNKNSDYKFDGVFDDTSSNQSIFETVTRPMVDASIDGYNCSVFAYGATGSGKTYTMLGNSIDPGVIYYTTKDLYEKLAALKEQDPLPAELKICYFEIYNEKIRDLLVMEPNKFFRCGNKRLRTTPERCRARQQGALGNGSNLPVFEAPGDSDSLIIPDLSYHTPENPDQLIDLLEAGNANRSQHPTDANADSSRSHAIFQIVITRRTRRLNNNNNPTGPEYELQTSKMSLIDLAGSERASVAYRPGNDRGKNLQREGGNINKSLLALGNCINALADPKTSHRYIPYRDSKLTRILKDSLGGNCRTAMVATICQEPSQYDFTHNTLTYATRANCIKTNARRNFTSVPVQPTEKDIIIEAQNKQIAILQSEKEELVRQLQSERENKQRHIPSSPRTSLHSPRVELNPPVPPSPSIHDSNLNISQDHNSSSPFPTAHGTPPLPGNLTSSSPASPVTPVHNPSPLRSSSPDLAYCSIPPRSPIRNSPPSSGSQRSPPSSGIRQNLPSPGSQQNPPSAGIQDRRPKRGRPKRIIPKLKASDFRSGYSPERSLPSPRYGIDMINYVEKIIDIDTGSSHYMTITVTDRGFFNTWPLDYFQIWHIKNGRRALKDFLNDPLNTVRRGTLERWRGEFVEEATREVPEDELRSHMETCVNCKHDFDNPRPQPNLRLTSDGRYAMFNLRAQFGSGEDRGYIYTRREFASNISYVEKVTKIKLTTSRIIIHVMQPGAASANRVDFFQLWKIPNSRKAMRKFYRENENVRKSIQTSHPRFYKAAYRKENDEEVE